MVETIGRSAGPALGPWLAGVGGAVQLGERMKMRSSLLGKQRLLACAILPICPCCGRCGRIWPTGATD